MAFLKFSRQTGGENLLQVKAGSHMFTNQPFIKTLFSRFSCKDPVGINRPGHKRQQLPINLLLMHLLLRLERSTPTGSNELSTIGTLIDPVLADIPYWQ